MSLITAAQCLGRYGDPSLQTSVTLWDVPSHLEIGVIPKRIYCNRDLIAPLTQAFETLIQRGLVAELRTWDGCFNIRKTRSAGSNSFSLHSWGLAVDVNAAWNGYGAKPTLSPAFVEAWEASGFSWGGRWTHPDGMHFQLAEFPAPATPVFLSAEVDLPTLRDPFPHSLSVQVLRGLLPHYSGPLSQRVKSFQSGHGLRPDGVVGPKTWLALLT